MICIRVGVMIWARTRVGVGVKIWIRMGVGVEIRGRLWIGSELPQMALALPQDDLRIASIQLAFVISANI